MGAEGFSAVKKMNKGDFVLALILLAFHFSFAEDLLQAFSPSAFQFEVVSLQAKEGHHFELAANQSCGEKAQILKKDQKQIQCQMVSLGESLAEFSICDDKKTFCKPVEVKFQIAEPPSGAKVSPLQKSLLEMKEMIHSELLPGFESFSLAEAQAKAKEKNAPVFVMISTDWCPPCNQSKEYVLSSPAFMKWSNGWLKIYVDGDSEKSKEYSEALSFSEYPTFILLNTEFEEVSRFREEITFDEFQSWWNRVSPYLETSYDKVKKKVLARRQDQLWQKILDFVFLRSDENKKRDFDFVLEVALAKSDQEFIEQTQFEEVPDFLKISWLSRRHDDLVPEKISEDEYNRRGLELAGLKPSYWSHLGELCKTKDPLCDSEKEKWPLRSDQIKDRKGKSKTENLLALADEYYAQMYFFKDLNKPQEVKRQARLCVEVFERLSDMSPLKFPRYAMQGLLACGKEYDLNRVEKAYLNLVDQYPGDPTFALRYARFLKEERKNLKQAKVWAMKALDLSYDFNWFYAASLKIQIDEQLKDKSSAVKTLNEAFSRLKLTADAESRDQQVLSRLRQLAERIQAI